MDNGYLGVDYTHLSGVLVQAINEQQNTINDLKLQLEEQKKLIDDIILKIRIN